METLARIFGLDSRRRVSKQLASSRVFELLESRLTLTAAAHLVADVNVTASGSGAGFWGFADAGEQTFFWANAPDALRSLWRTDGTAEGTRFVNGTQGRGLTSSEGRAYFLQFGRDLWTSDGTPEGTHLSLTLATPSTGSSYYVDYSTLYVAPDMYFRAGAAVWQLGGWPSGWGLAANGRITNERHALGIYSSSDGRPSDLTLVGSLLYYYGANSTQSGLWRSDGTAEGTFVVKPFGSQDAQREAIGLTAFRGELLFLSRSPSNPDRAALWKSNGTIDGTEMIRELGPLAQARFVTAVVADALYFAAFDDASAWGVWKTDGTAEGTLKLAQVGLGVTGDETLQIGGADNDLFVTITGSWSFAAQAWHIDAVTQATTLLVSGDPAQARSQIDDSIVVGVTFFFAADFGPGKRGLWKSDGTVVGTEWLKDVWSPRRSSRIRDLMNINGRLLFIGDDDRYGQEIWQSDGTSAGTTVLKEIWTQTMDGEIGAIAAVGETAFFVASSGMNDNLSHHFGLYRTDLSAAGTELVLAPPEWLGKEPNSLVGAGGNVYFAANGPRGIELWESDGTPEGTVPFSEILAGRNEYFVYPEAMTELGGMLVFTASSANGPRTLWRTDGTAAGTRLFTSVFPTGRRYANRPYEFPHVVLDEVMYFLAWDEAHGTELWRTDSAGKGTWMVKDVLPGSASGAYLGSIGYCQDMVVWRGEVYFIANDGVGGLALWKTDGTEVGTRMVDAIRTGRSESDRPHGLFATEQFVFFVASNGDRGWDLWKSDGTEHAAEFVMTLTRSDTDGDVLPIGSAGNSFFFYLSKYGKEGLWVTDGTTSDAWKVLDGLPEEPVAVFEDRLMFTTEGCCGQTDLWISDGTATGTTRVAILNNSLDNFFSPDLKFVGRAALFPRDDGIHGIELWSYGPTIAGDLNHDYRIDRRDMAMLARSFGQQQGATAETGDLDGDGAIGLIDVLMLRNGSNAAPTDTEASAALVQARTSNGNDSVATVLRAKRRTLPTIEQRNESTDIAIKAFARLDGLSSSRRRSKHRR